MQPVDCVLSRLVLRFYRQGELQSCYMVWYPKLHGRSGCRYLVARKCCVCKATKALAKTLHWRQQFRPDLITWEQVRMCGTPRT